MKKLILLMLFATSCWAARPVQITTNKLPSGQTTVAYVSTQLKARYGTRPYAWTVNSGTIPTGLSFSSPGVLSGTPTVVGTFVFVIRVTDATSVTYDRGYYIVISAGAVVPEPTLQISTTSLAEGIQDSAYNLTLQATGGTSPYTWSNTSGNIPTGITLSSAGVLSGTPTVAGTYDFNVRATDSGTETYDRAYRLVINSAVAPTYLFSDTLANGFASWGFRWNSTDVTTAACPGGGNCAQFHYVICGDSTNTACGDAHQDTNRWISKIMSPALEDSFFRGYVYFKTPEAGASDLVQRKIYWISDCLSAGGCSPEGWTVVLTNDEVVAPLQPYVLVTRHSPSTVSTRYNLTGTLNHDTFYSIEIEVDLNTPNVSDGAVKVWVDGVQKLNQTSINIRGDLSTGATFFSLGRQSDRHNYNVVNEYRYWKNAIINNSLIGP